MTPPIRVALLGYGLGGMVFHAPLIAAVDGLELAAIVTRNEARRVHARREHPGAALLDSADAVWERADDFGLVVVATPNRFHVPLARTAIELGLAVVVDKPLAPSASEAEALAQLARDRNVMLTVSHNRRWDGDFLTVQELLAGKELGPVTRFESRFERWRPALGDGWRESGDSEEAGGLLFDLGSHLVDQALCLFGPAAHVYAELDERRPGAQVDDDAFVALTHASGVRSHLWMSAVAGQLGPRFRVLGLKAAYVKFGLDVQEESLRAGMKPGEPLYGREPEERWGRVWAGEESRAVATRPGAYQRFYEGVVASIREGAPPPVDPGEVVAGLEALEAARKSARERRVVEPG